jgi:hypothetical protein
MVAEYFHIEVSSFHSLLVIISILGTGLVASVVARNREAEEAKLKAYGK